MSETPPQPTEAAPSSSTDGSRIAAPEPTSRRDPLHTIEQITAAARAMARPVTSWAVTQLLLGVGEALNDGESGDRAVIWTIAPDGTRMRQIVPAATENPWIPADGAVAQVLGARRPIELGLIIADPLERATARSKTDDARDIRRPFGRFHPVFDGNRIACVLGIVRRPGRPMFDRNDRIVLDAAADRIEDAFAARALTEELRSQRDRGLNESNGVVISADLLHDLGEISGDLVLRHLFSGQGTEYVSGGVLRATGYTAEEMMSDHGLLDRIIHPDDRHVLLDVIEDLSLARKPLVVRILRRDGTIAWQLVRLRPLLDDRGKMIGFEGMATDVTAMKLAEAELAHQARSDPLTGLSNRLNFREATTRAIARVERHPGMMGVLFLDLDGFKLVNDTLGHPAGDEVLRQVADRLRRVIRREDMVARLGGDEFAVLLTEIRDSGEAAATARRILEALDVPISVGDHEANVSSGVGIAVSADAIVDVDELVSRADIALYQAKRAGRGRWQVFEGPSGTTTTMQLPLDSRLTEVPARRPGPVISEGTLRAALAAGEFRVHYLPEVDAVTGQIVGVEALVRWAHPDHGLLKAQTFIAEARSSEVIHSLGDWVVHEATRQVSAWRTLFGVDIALWVNVCSEQLQREGFADTVLATLSATGFPAHRFGVDIAEVDFARVEPSQERSLSLISRAGVQLAIDDFGDGGSSLKALRRLPLAQIKLGRNATNALLMSGSSGSGSGSGSGSRSDELFPLTVKLAGSLGAKVVAIGVERFEQLQELRTLQCELFQGELGGDEQTPESMADLLADGQLTIPGLT